MKKDECEQAIRHLCGKWAKEKGYKKTAEEMPSFTEFYSWVQNGYSGYLNFRTTTSVSFDVEMWFDDEFKQNWRR